MIKEIIIYYTPLPWFNQERLKSILSNLANINNKLHFTGWRVISVNVDTNNHKIIIKAVPPKYVELGVSDYLIPIVVIGSLIIAAGVVVVGWKTEEIKQNELEFKKSVIKAVEEKKIPKELAEKVISSTTQKQQVPDILSSIKYIILSISLLFIIYFISKLIKVLGGVKIARL